jgi:trk system potassium uptake protein TrkA
MRDVFGLTMAVNPEKQAAHEIARLLNFPGFLSVDSFAKGNVEIVELKIDAKNPLNGTKLSKMSDLVHSQVLVCAVQRNGQTIMPDGNFVIRENDQLFFTATPTNLTQMLKNIGIIAKKAKRVLIAGGGRISYYLVKELEKSGMDCTIMESDEERCHELADILPECTVIHGDASSQEFLDMEGVGDSDAVVTLTGLDELNIVISLYANTRNVSQVVTKLSHAENNKILDSLQIGAVISPKELAGYSILRYVRAMQNQEGSAVSVHRIAGGKIEALEFKVDKDTKHRGEPLRNVKTKSNVLIASIFSHGKVDIPSGNSRFNEGDTVIVVTTADAPIYNLNDIFED